MFVASPLCHSVTRHARFWCSPLGEDFPAQTVCNTEPWPRKQHTRTETMYIMIGCICACMYQRPVDVCKAWSKQARYTQNIVFVPRRFSTPLGVTKRFVFLRLVAFTQRYALPARRFTHALCVTCRTFGFCTVHT